MKMAPSGWTLKKDGTKVVPLEAEIPHFVWHSSLCWMISINSNVPKIIKSENSRHWIIYNRFKKYLQTSKLVADHLTFSGSKNNKIVSDKSVARYLSWWWNRGYLTWPFKIIICYGYFGNSNLSSHFFVKELFLVIQTYNLPCADEGTAIEEIAVVSLCGLRRRSWESPEYEKKTQFSTLK